VKQRQPKLSAVQRRLQKRSKPRLKKKRLTKGNTLGVIIVKHFLETVPFVSLKKGKIGDHHSRMLPHQYCLVVDKYVGYALFQWSNLDILRPISNFATTCQLPLIRVLEKTIDVERLCRPIIYE